MASDFLAARALPIDQSSSSSSLYKKRNTDHDETMPDQTWPSQPPPSPDFKSWLNQPNDESYDSRRPPVSLRRRSPLPDFQFPARSQPGFERDPDFKRIPDFEPKPDFDDGHLPQFERWPNSERWLEYERDGWSPEPLCSQMQQNPPAHIDPASRLPAVLDMSFLELFPPGHVTISYSNDVGDVQRYHGINRDPIEDCSFLLSQAIDGNGLHLEACTSLTIRPFLQFVYTGTYHLPTATGEVLEDVPTSLLVHCQMFRLGDIYDIPELKSFANVHIIRQCEFGCSSPNQPVDLCAAIDYVYRNMREHCGVIETIIAYCVTCFLSHGLGDNFEFRRLAFDLRPFHQDLCKIGMERRFEDDHIAQAIIQMPFKPYVPATYASREDRRAKQIFDDVYHFHGDDDDLMHKARRRAGQQVFASDVTLPVLPGPSKSKEGCGSATEDDGLGQTIGQRRRRNDDQTLDGSGPSGKRKSNGLTLRQKCGLPHVSKPDVPQGDESGVEGDARFWHPYGRLQMDTVLNRSIEKAAEDGVQTISAPSKARAGESRELCHDIVSVGLAGRPDTIVRPSATNQIGGISAALPKAEVDKSNSDAEYEMIPSPIRERKHESGSDSDFDFVRIERSQTHSPDVDMQRGSDRGSEREKEVGSASDSEWDVI